MKKILSAIALLAGLAATSQSASAERLVVKFKHEKFKNERIYLGQSISDQLDIKIKKYKIKNITLFAKSKTGTGSATLVMDDRTSPKQSIPGYREDFGNNEGYTYASIPLKPTGNKKVENKLQIILSGKIKVLKVVLNVEKIRTNQRFCNHNGERMRVGEIWSKTQSCQITESVLSQCPRVIKYAESCDCNWRNCRPGRKSETGMCHDRMASKTVYEACYVMESRQGTKEITFKCNSDLSVSQTRQSNCR